jgi:hypothetical protein
MVCLTFKLLDMKHSIKRIFWSDIWAKWMTIAIIVSLIQLSLLFLHSNPSLFMMCHVIVWPTWFIICVIVRLIHMKN